MRTLTHEKFGKGIITAEDVTIIGAGFSGL
jgi:cyanate lyase